MWPVDFRWRWKRSDCCRPPQELGIILPRSPSWRFDDDLATSGRRKEIEQTGLVGLEYTWALIVLVQTDQWLNGFLQTDECLRLKRWTPVRFLARSNQRLKIGIPRFLAWCSTLAGHCDPSTVCGTGVKQFWLKRLLGPLWPTHLGEWNIIYNTTSISLECYHPLVDRFRLASVTKCTDLYAGNSVSAGNSKERNFHSMSRFFLAVFSKFVFEGSCRFADRALTEIIINGKQMRLKKNFF